MEPTARPRRDFALQRKGEVRLAFRDPEQVKEWAIIVS